MFLKLLSLLLIPSTYAWVFAGGYSQNFTVENHVLTEVNDKTANEIRIYENKEVTSIAADAFNDCQFTSIMISKTVTAVDAAFPHNVTIYFTGSSEEVLFNIPNDATLIEYGCDEGFMNYWVTYIRPNIDGTICNVSRANYLRMRQLYNNLTNYDQGVVEAKEDGTGTVKDSIAYLDNYFGKGQSSQSIGREIPQSVMLTLILIIASFGMTSIGIFYLLKDRKIIE